GFLCDDPARSTNETCINQDVVDKLTELRELHRARPGDDDRWRVLQYSRAIRALRAHPTRITTEAQARTLDGVGAKTANKILEIVRTGELRRLKYADTEDVRVVRLFNGIYGAGLQISWRWYAAGARTLDDLRAKRFGIKLSRVQRIGLHFYDADINTRMPRSEARAIFEAIKPVALKLDPDLFVEIMGSYRRGKATCGDIDILLSRPTADGRTHAGILLRLLDALHAAGILTEDLAIPDADDALEGVYRGLCVRPGDERKVRRRIDILAVPWTSRGAALVYYTGDDIFNRSMRLKASKMGYSLNQRGLYAGVVRAVDDRTKKTCEGKLIASETEEAIFSALGVSWQEPHERARG
ncbi:Nucleotidyltransferase, partial [Vararia minispora EC-137]